MRRQNYWRCLTLLSVILGTGCYTYAPIQSPQRGMEVRARLTAEAAARRSQGLDDPVLRYDGTIVESTAGAVSLDVLVARSSSAFQDVEIRDTVRLETTEIQSILARKISPGRSALITVAAGVAAFAIVKGINQIVGGTGDDPDDGEPPALRFPLVRVRALRSLIVVGFPVH